MKRVDIHHLWAPGESTWRPWVKPVLFAHVDEDTDPKSLPPPPPWLEQDLLAPLHGGRAYRSSARLADVFFVVDLPGAEGTMLGVSLAEHGFRPVPLYNAIPRAFSVVDLDPILAVLVDGAPRLADLPDEAPPAFLLDARRSGRGQRPVVDGCFDNRSYCSPGDFPSAEVLLQAGLRRAVLVQPAGATPAPDLARVLFAWQAKAIELLLFQTRAPAPPEAGAITPPSAFSRAGAFLQRLSFERAGAGTFGGEVSRSSSGG